MTLDQDGLASDGLGGGRGEGGKALMQPSQRFGGMTATESDAALAVSSVGDGGRGAAAPDLRARQQWSARWSLTLLVGLATPATTIVTAPELFDVGAGAVAFLAVSTTVFGLAAGALVTAPVTAQPVGRIELAIRAVLVTSALVGGIWAAGAVATTDGSPPLRLAGAVAGGGCLLLVVGLVAVRWWQAQVSHPAGDAVRAGDQSPAPLPFLCRYLKRVMDLTVAVVVLPVAVVLGTVSAAAVVAESRGGWLFAQRRLGAGGRPFRMLKLRTMLVGNDDRAHKVLMTALIRGEPTAPVASGTYGTYGKVVDDPRRTRVGAVLRRWSIDELPQLWNVLKGEMSLVGPRPPLPWEAELYDVRAAGRLLAKPGMTGLWQVSGRSRLRFDEMVELDLHYLERWSPWLDFKIMARTPAAVWSRCTE